MAQEQLITQTMPSFQAPILLPQYAVETMLGPVPEYLDNPHQCPNLLSWVETDLGVWLDSQELDSIPCRLEELVDKIGLVSINHLVVGLLHHSSGKFKLLLKKKARAKKMQKQEKRSLGTTINWSAPASQYFVEWSDEPLKVYVAKRLDLAFSDRRVSAEAGLIAIALKKAMPSVYVTGQSVQDACRKERRLTRMVFDQRILDRPAGEVLEGWDSALTLRKAIARALDNAERGKRREVLVSIAQELTQKGYPVSEGVLRSRVSRERVRS